MFCSKRWVYVIFLVKFTAKCGTSKKALFYHLSNQYF